MDVTAIVAQAGSLSLFEEIIQLGVRGLGLGAIYALIALGFVIIYKATEVINFSHGALLLLGTYITFSLVSGSYPAMLQTPSGGQAGGNFPAALSWWVDLPIMFRFSFSVVIAMVIVGTLGIIIERTTLRWMIGRPVFAIVLITLGLELVISTAVSILWNPQQKVLTSPWSPLSVVRFGDIAIQWSNLWVIIITSVVFLLFLLFFRYSKFGVAMRATAFDQEAAMAMGIKTSTVFAIAWAIGGAMAALAGALFVPTQLTGFVTLTPVRFAALGAFPAAILGGLDSPGGAIVGGVTIGLAQVYSARWLNPLLADLNLDNFHLIFPYIIMITILLIRPYGLFGTTEVRRV